MSGYDRGRRDDYDRRDRDYDRDRSSHRGDDRRGGGDRGYDRGGGGYDRGGRDDRRGGGGGYRGGGGGRGGGGFRGGGRGRGGGGFRGRGGGGRGGMKRAPEVNVDELNFPGQRDVIHCRAENQIHYNPLGTRYSQLENSDVRQKINEISGQADMDIPKMDPNQSITGRNIKLVKNEFKINILDENKLLGLWRVDIQPTSTGKFDKPLKKEDLRNVIHNVCQKLGCAIAFDGSELAVTHQDMSALRSSNDVRIDYETKAMVIRGECTSQKKPREVEVRMKQVHELGWQRLQEYINGETEQMPTDVIQVLDIILKAQVCKDVAFVKKGMMVPRNANLRMNAGNNLTEGRQVWNGIHQSAHISSWKTGLGNVNHLTLNLDLSYTQVMAATPISEQLYNCQGDNDIRQLEAAMMHLTFQNTVDNKYYKLAGFARGQLRSEQCRFEKGGRPVSVADYWTNKGARIRSPELRPVKVKQGRDFIMIPAECCKLLPGQKPKTMNERHKGDMIRASAEPAPDRLNKIKSLVADKELYGADELKKFGFEVDAKPMEAEGVVLDTPLMLDGENAEIKVNNGEWKTKKFFKPHPKKLLWMTVYIRNEQNRVDRRDFEDTFCKAFVATGQRLGMTIEAPVAQEQVDDYVDFQKMADSYKRNGKDLGGLNFVLLCGGTQGDSAKHDYECIKLTAESNLGCLTQFIRGKTVQAEVENLNRGKQPEISRNLWLKLNEKMSGTNWKIEVPLPPTSKPIMVVGCSFSHAEADDDGAKAKPTFVGFASTTTTGATGYVNSCYHQDPRLNIVCYNVLEKAFKHMIESFGNANNGVLPEVIIWYRGGASTGAFQQILKNEMKALRQLCSNVREGYCPQISFIVCIRNSHSKLFAANAKDQVGDGKNVPAGTAVTGFGAAPDSFHFHLCSHAGVGTVNPTFYQVLHDDNQLHLDNVVKMTYALTMDSKRCEKSISEPAPVRLASLRAERGLAHWNGALEIVQSDRDRDAADYLRKDSNKLGTRSRFKKENFFI